MPLHQEIKEELKKAMKDKNANLVSVLRGFIAAFTNELVARKRIPSEALSDDDVLSVISKQAKQRKDSIEQFRKGGREDLASSEEAELKIIETYLPEKMSREEIKKIAKLKKDELGITDKSKVGMLVGAIMKEIQGKADGNDVKKIVDSMF
ncbi:MAG: glutamyl-tRNA amidotransferase [Candidatus Levybacteria bacterium CG10_big_fil_rev_8_21_14_0_10_36_7]|nr:MAG: glutamyl-tRNA amidotransferase [Candidatus Levybacteria bacterium CG10_big_fil_rev_8_21_14_0_10_36_7]